MSWFYGDVLDPDLGIPTWDGTGVALPVGPNGWPVVPDLPTGVVILIDDVIDVVVDEPLIYTTRLSNFGPAIASATQVYTFAWADGTPMELDDIEYANEDTGVPVIITLTKDGDVLHATQTYPIPADLRASSRVRITAYKTGVIDANSTITDDADDSELASKDYQYNVLAALAVEGEPDTPVDEGEPEEPDDEDVTDEGYDPSEHTVVEVQAYLDENPDQTDYVLDRERAGKNRTTLTGGA